MFMCMCFVRTRASWPFGRGESLRQSSPITKWGDTENMAYVYSGIHKEVSFVIHGSVDKKFLHNLVSLYNRSDQAHRRTSTELPWGNISTQPHKTTGEMFERPLGLIWAYFSFTMVKTPDRSNLQKWRFALAQSSRTWGSWHGRVHVTSSIGPLGTWDHQQRWATRSMGPSGTWGHQEHRPEVPHMMVE